MRRHLLPMMVAGLVASPLAAQSYTQQLQGYMNNYSGPILNSGFQIVTQMVTNGINSGATGNHPVTMNAGFAISDGWNE